MLRVCMKIKNKIKKRAPTFAFALMLKTKSNHQAITKITLEEEYKTGKKYFSFSKFQFTMFL